VVAAADADLAARLRLLREYGWRERYVSAVPGENSRLDELQAAVLRVKLRHLDAGNARRRAAAARYDALLADAPVARPRTRPEATPVFHQYVIRSPRRDDLRASLQSRGVGTLIHYPVPVHRQPAYARFAAGAPLGETERAAREVLSLPLYPEMPPGDLERAAAAVRAWAGLAPAPNH
jgi:dTDP-4-amino-4,6-dideoxygalactose transaminase